MCPSSVDVTLDGWMVYMWAAPEVTEYGKPFEFAVSKMIVSVPQDV